jgi:raffinose/stachyose/melibiose transport system permease protein
VTHGVQAEKLVSHAILAVLSLLAILPMLGLVLAAFNGSSQLVSGFAWPTTWSLGNFEHAWLKGNFGRGLLNSAVIALLTVAGTTLLSAMAGYVFAVGTLRWKNAAFALLLLGLVVPGEAIIVPLYYDMRQFLSFLRGNYAVIVLPEVGKFLAFGCYWMRAAFEALPKEVTEAAKLDGATGPQVFGLVLLPLVRPALLTLAVLIFMWSWNDFLLPLVMLANNPDLQTAPLGLATFSGQRSTDVLGLSAAALIVSVPIVVFYLIFQRQLIRGLLHGAVQ